MHKSFVFKYKLHYLIAFGSFIVWMFFFDEKDYFTQQQRKKELATLETKIDNYKNQIADMRKQIKALDTDTSMLEKFAREKYFMKRDNEEVFIVNP